MCVCVNITCVSSAFHSFCTYSAYTAGVTAGNLYFENSPAISQLFEYLHSSYSISECVSLVPQPSPLRSLWSDVGGLQLVDNVRLPVAARLAVLLPVGVLLHLGQEVAVFVLSRRRSSRLL